MDTQNIAVTITVDQTPLEVFQAINNVRAWWTGEFTGSTDKLGEEFTYQYHDMHFSRQRITEFVPGIRVVWEVIESQLTFVDDEDEWTGTKMIFEINEVDGKTELHFTHKGITPTVECFDACSGAWSQLIKQGLYSLITTGKTDEVIL